MNKQKLIEIFKQHNPNTPMTEEETMVAMKLMMSGDKTFQTPIDELDTESEVYKHFKPLLDDFLPQVFLKRLEHLTSLRITLGALIMIAQHLQSPGNAVMYVFYLHTKLPENTVVTINEISMDLFPWGFFSQEQLQTIWDAQKVRSDECKELTCIGAPDNMLDYVENWK